MGLWEDHIFAKFFQKEKHVDDFLVGNCMQIGFPISRTLRNASIEVMNTKGVYSFDLMVVLSKLAAQNPVTGTVREFTIAEYDLAGPMIMHPRWFDHINLFCMYACHTGTLDGVAVQDVHELKKHLEIPEDCARLGTHAVVIMNGKEFLRRIMAGAEMNGYRVRGGLVKYYDAGEGIDLPSNDIDTISISVRNTSIRENIESQ